MFDKYYEATSASVEQFKLLLYIFFLWNYLLYWELYYKKNTKIKTKKKKEEESEKGNVKIYISRAGEKPCLETAEF